MLCKPLAYKNVVLYNDSQIPQVCFLSWHILYTVTVASQLDQFKLMWFACEVLPENLQFFDHTPTPIN